MSVYDITLTDPTEPGRPATYVLHVTAVDQMVFVSICDYDEGNPETKMVAKASIGVSLPALRDALNLLSSDGFREDMRERDQHGPRSRIGGHRVGSVPL